MIPLFAAIALASTPLQAQEQPSATPHAYAVLVGSNQAGPGQQPLQWAVKDAQRMKQVLVELGGFPADQVQLVQDPSVAGLMSVLDQHAAVLGAHAAMDEDALFVFYYSGHAKAQGLELGTEELPLDALEAKLEALPSTFTLVVLDACQAGAISGVKGAAPAADFSYNATEGLNTRGLAVLASSTGTELSQESADLEGSYFTHHLVTGLRGAADDDSDGRVTLDEVYSYAYNRTLVSTAQTAVGRQHVTLETRIEGKGQTVLTRPRDAEAFLRLPAEMQGELLVYRTKDRLVSAELHKAAGAPLRVGLIPGDYEALLRQDDDLYRCELNLGTGTTVFYPGTCELVPVVVDVEGKGSLGSRRHEHLVLELGINDIVRQEGAFTDRLGEFGFADETTIPGWAPQGSLAYTFLPHLGAVFTVGNLDYDGRRRDFDDDTSTIHRFTWETWRAALQARASLPLFHGWLTPYIQGGGGPALGITNYHDMGDDSTEIERQWGWHVSGAGGLQLMPTAGKSVKIGIYNQVEFSKAEVIENLLEDVHDSGGMTLSAGLRIGF
jgi:hypothetical protein